jgi:peptidoglycan/xylan/chitin deacetylase (PgdA/CDA1 family)
MVAVTYDDGPHLTNTPALLALLEKYGVVATFFEVGSRLETMPQFLTQMEELGCEIGNHSYSHSNLTRLSSSGVYQEIEKTNALIRQEVGHDATVVRAPGGNINSTVKSAIDFPLINWSIDTQDWKYRSSSHVISVIKNAGNLDGDVILMHSLYSSTVEASETIIPWLIEQGYQLVTVSELARYRDVDLTSGSVYYSF